MNATMTYADAFHQTFAHESDFLNFLKDIQSRSHWDRHPAHDLEIIALDEGDPLTQALHRQYEHLGTEGILDDTMEHTRLLLKAQDELTPVRSCAIKTILDRARISGSALSQLSKPHLAEVLNRCLNIARGNALLWYSDGKISAVHGGDANDYAVLEIPELFQHAVQYLSDHFPGYTFAGGSFDHSMVTAIWELTDQDDLIETYRTALARHGLLDDETSIRPAVRLSTSNTGISGANLYPMLLEGAGSKIVPLGSPIRENHKNGADLTQFDENLVKLFAQYQSNLDTLTELLDIELAYRNSRALREIVSFLAPFGISIHKCMQIREYFGSDSVQILRKTPFSLCRIRGFGFKTVDEIARRMHCTPDDPQRIQGAILYALNEASHAGHVFLSQENLCRQASRLLKGSNPDSAVPDSLIAAQIYELSIRRELIANEGAIYRRRLFEAENRTAQAIASLAKQPVQVFPHLEAVVEQSQKELGLMLSARQCEAVRNCMTQPLSLLTGGPGTGKTTVLKVILDVYQKLVGGRILQAAPTGRAARRMMQSTGLPAGTLHSALGLIAKREGSAYHTKGLVPLAADFVVVDETSMVDILLAEELFQRIRPGTKVLLVGDADQLPSVGPGNVFRDLICSGVLPVTRLDTVFRQSGTSRIALNAQLIQQNRATLLEGPDFQFLACADEAAAAAMVQRLYIGYVYVNEIGELIHPDYISTEFPKFLRKHGLRKIRFHDTRHSCASLLLRNGVSMKQIQAWLGHSDYGTTANLYAHLDLEDSMLLSASMLTTGLFGASTDHAPSTDSELTDPRHGTAP